jgi:phosphoribosyl 1,2-cyclic phosphodiesterase
MRLSILASSSAGNCALVEAAGAKILIDAGISFKKLEAALEEQGVAVSELTAVLLTHEHSDHVAGVGGLASAGVPLYATAGTASAVEGMIKRKIGWRLLPSEGAFVMGELRVMTFALPHDACEPVGYVISDAQERLIWALDIGHLTAATERLLATATTLVLESNYCPKRLQADTKRPFSLKQRIMGRHGHLSNEDAYNYLTKTRSASWRQIYLAHLSRECNSVAELQARYAATGLPVEVVDPAGVAVLAGR